MAVEPDDGGANPNGAKRRLGGFELVRKLGQGAVGVVFLARQTSMDRAVALKVLPKRLAKDKGFVERFLREARAAARLNHPNIVQAIDAGKSGGYFYFAMEYVDGEPLQEVLATTGALPEQWALEIARDVADGLDHAHQAGVLHRDVKPGNIMIGSDRRAKLTDLGLARELQQHDAAITQAGAALGTPHYISPEQVRGERDLDGRTDVYSLGATLYHMLTGSTPFSGGTSAEVMAHHLTEPVPSPKKANSEVSYRAAEIVRRAMAKDPDARYPTAAALRDDISDLLVARAGAGPVWAEADAEPAAPPEAAAPTDVRPARWRMLPVLGGAALVALLVVLLAGGLLRPRPDETPDEQARSGGEISGTEPADPEPGPEETEPAPEPGETPAPEPPKPSTELARLKAEIETLIRQAAFGQGLKRLEAFARSHPGADPAALDALHAGIVEAAAKRYRRRVEQADDAARRRDYARGRTLLQSIESFGLDAYTRRAEKKLAELAAERKYWSDWERARGEAEERTAAGKYDAARERLDQARHLPLHGIGALVDAELQAVARARQQAGRQARAAYAERSKAFWALLGQRKYAKADALLARARTEVTDPGVKPYLRADSEAAAHIQTFWSRVEDGLKDRRGQFISFADARGKIADVADGQVTIEAGGETKTRSLHQLTVEQALAYAKRAEAVPPVATGTFLLAERASLDEAEQAFADAPAGPSLEIYREKLARLRAPDIAADKAWKEIEEAAGGSLSAAEARRLTGLLAAFEKEYEGTKRLAGLKDRIAALRVRAGKAKAGKDAPGWSSLFSG
ncbi:MAG: protein kinase domain-containing protein, partial [bacterium]